ncbi:MAG: putative 2-aminoethylphosphonate ABC transporter ATP-binding protein [Burkholderiales bacterium]|nr:putative 2-aminoethylphosphonate ABC transporter ATP-binding protein [Burkholderiales bacterium]
MRQVPEGHGVALQIEGVGKRFGKTEVLRDVSLTVAHREFVCVLGPSGCGKSTLLRIVAGLEQQTSGRLWKDGQEISRLEPAARDVGMLFQSYALFPNLTVRENVGYGLVNRGIAREEIARRVTDLLALVELPGTEAKLPVQLSGGEQQRVALARALAPSPRLLLLDEPLSALDARVRVNLRQQITQLQRKLKLTTIMVTHDQVEALTMADRVVVMSRGAIEQIGTPTEIYQQPATRFVADFVGKMNFIEARAAGDGTLEAGALKLRVVAPAAAAGTVVLGFRPEEVSFRRAPDGTSAWAARITGIEFLGAAWRATLLCPGLGGHEIHADFSARDGRAFELQSGQDVFIDIPADRLHVFGSAPAAAQASA